MTYGIGINFDIVRYDPSVVEKVHQITAKLTLPDVSNPGMDVVGFPAIVMYWNVSDSYGSVLPADIDAFHQALVDFVADYTGMSDVTGGIVTTNTYPITPTP